MEQDRFYAKLSELILRIQEEYDRTNDLWAALSGSNDVRDLNMGRIRVRHCSDTPDLNEQTKAYRDFIADNLDESRIALDDADFDVAYRVKTLDSIFDKIRRYNRNPRLLGNTPVNKCLNDVFGIRMIVQCTVMADDIIGYVNDRHPGLKVLDSSKTEDDEAVYIATHIYFRESNRRYPWELQKWSVEHTETNYESHRERKEAYVRWSR